MVEIMEVNDAPRRLGNSANPQATPDAYHMLYRN